MQFKLDDLIASVCAEAGVDPKVDILEDSEYASMNLSITYENLLVSVIYQNWDPGFKLKPDELISHLNEFEIKNLSDLKDSFINFRLDDGLVPNNYLVTYLNFAQKYFKNGLFITDIFESADMFINLEQITNTRLPVLIFGETGTEKKLLAEVIHRTSPWNNSPFKVINCKGLSDDSIYSQIFGHLKGSYPGAVKDYKGALGTIKSGTLFIDELKDLGPKCQNGLIRYLKEAKFSSLGDVKSDKSKCRIIFATNAFIKAEMDNIRSDFYYEITKLTLTRFPLRHFRNNIPLLIAFQALKRDVADVIFPVELLNYWLKINPWTGNYQQLYGEIDRYLLAFVDLKERNSIGQETIAFAPVDSNLKSSSIFHSNSNDYSEDTILLNSLLGLFNLHSFVDYMNSKNYISGNIYDISSMVSCPFLQTVLYNVDEKGKEHYDMEKYDKFSIINCQKAYRELIETYNLKISETGGVLANEAKSGLKCDKIQLSISEYNMIQAKIDKHNYAIPGCDLIQKSKSSEIFTIKFNKRYNMQFSMLLFLILERVNDEIDWLKMEFPQMREFDGFQKICAWCSIPKTKLDKVGWWDDPINDRRKGYVHEINEKLDPAGILGELVVINPNIAGVYNLNPSLKAAIVTDIQ